jgi:hypothetical protein
MAKLLEEVVVVKLSRLVRDTDSNQEVMSDEQKAVISAALPALVEEVINDTSIIVELAELG